MTFLGADLSGIGDAFTGAGGSIGNLLIVILAICISGVGIFIWFTKKKDKADFIATVNLFKVVNGKKFWVGSDKAKEVVVPGTNVRLLYWKGRKLWSAYPTRSIGFNVYAYMINRMGEMTNFDLGEGEDEFEAKIDYDHRDQTYAYLNLQEFITRNYKQREKIAWWKEHIGIISTIIILIILGLELWYFTSQTGSQLQQWSEIAKQFSDASKTIAQAVSQSSHLGSGIVGG